MPTPIQDIWQNVYNSVTQRLRVEGTGGGTGGGDVVIIDGVDSSKRASVVTDSTKSALLIKDISEALKSNVNVYGDSSVTGMTEVSLASFVVPSGKTFVFTGAFVGGNSDGKFTLKNGGGTFATARNSAATRTLTIEFWTPPKISAGGTVEIRVFNESGATRTFEATINGYTLPV